MLNNWSGITDVKYEQHTFLHGHVHSIELLMDHKGLRHEVCTLYVKQVASVLAEL